MYKLYVSSSFFARFSQATVGMKNDLRKIFSLRKSNCQKQRHMISAVEKKSWLFETRAIFLHHHSLPTVPTRISQIDLQWIIEKLLLALHELQLESHSKNVSVDLQLYSNRELWCK